MAIVEDRNIIFLGKLGVGKSHCGNGILGLINHFTSVKGWNSGTRECEYGSATRNGRRYRVFDTPGINSIKDANNTVDVKEAITRCLLCTAPGFHALVLALSSDDRITNEDVEMVKSLEKILGKQGYEHMILAVTKMDEDYVLLEKLIAQQDQIKSLDEKCQSRRVIFGNNNQIIPVTCLKRFDDELEKLIVKNRLKGQEYFEHELYAKASRILEKDKEDYMKKHPDVTTDFAMEEVRKEAASGLSPRNPELLKVINRSCCVIL